MTVDNELVRVGNPIARGGIADLILPEYVMAEELNTTIPTEKALYEESADKDYPISTQLRFKDSLWRYSHAGAAISNLGFLKGNYTICPGSGGNSSGVGFEGALYAAVVAGATSFTIADTAAAKNLYQGAYFVVYNDTDNVWESHEVIGNDASTGVYTTCYIGLPGFKNALTTGYGITVYLNEYYDIRNMAAGGGYQSALGYAKLAITTDYYFWLQTAGRISGLTGASTWPGQTQYYRDVYSNTDGSLIGYTAGYQRVGVLLSRTASNYGDNFIRLELDK